MDKVRSETENAGIGHSKQNEKQAEESSTCDTDIVIFEHTANANNEITYKLKQRLMTKDVIAVSLGFMFLFTAFFSLANLQSTLNREAGLGTIGLAVIYASLIMSCLIAPPMVIHAIGCKWTIALSMLCYVFYMAANVYATWWTIIPTSIIMGIGAAPLWSAKCTYLTEMGIWYADMKTSSAHEADNRFFGMFFGVFKTSQVWGNLVSSLVFSQRQDNATEISADRLLLCGANDCPAADTGNLTELTEPPTTQVYIVCGVYIACALLGFAIVAIFLDNITLNKDITLEKGKKISFKLMTVTFLHCWRSPYQKLLIPLTIYSGLEQGFITSEFTRSYVSCSVGIWNVGYIMMAFGVADAVSSFAFGRLVHYVGHTFFFILAFLVHTGTMITLLLWLPDPDMTYVLYILAILWGVGDAVMQTQIGAFYGVLFSANPEAAFSNYRLWESLGFLVAFAYSGVLCTNIKIYICMAVCTIGTALYGVTEVLYRRDVLRASMLKPEK